MNHVLVKSWFNYVHSSKKCSFEYTADGTVALEECFLNKKTPFIGFTHQQMLMGS